MNLICLISFFLVFIPFIGKTQDTRVLSPTIDNLDFNAFDDKIIINYELNNCNSFTYDVQLVFEEQNTSNKIVPKSIRGDIKNVSCGSKQIIWDIRKDYTTLTGNFYPVLSILKIDNTVKDVDGNSYNTIHIGKQIWFAENLKTSKYNDGTSIPHIVNDSLWISSKSGAWCHYNNDQKNNDKYGKLYNLYVVSGNKNVCPSGWHVPTNVEWTILINYLGGERVAGGKMKEKGTINWEWRNKQASNSSGFTALPGGERSFNGKYYNIGSHGYWWSSTENNTFKYWFLELWNYFGSAHTEETYSNQSGMSVRCLRD